MTAGPTSAVGAGHEGLLRQRYAALGSFGHGLAFFATRGTNGALVLLQLALVARLFAPADAAAFFVFWSVGWFASVVVRFGFDELIPKLAASALRSGELDDLAGLRRVAPVTLGLVALVLPFALTLLLPGHPVAQAAAAFIPALVAAAAWTVLYMLAGLAKGYGRVALSGIVQGAIAPAAVAAAVPLAYLGSGSWLLLAAISSAALVAAAAVSYVLVARALGRGPVHAALSLPRAGRRIDRDAIPAAALIAIREVTLWLPLWLPSALGYSEAALAGVYAALRISGVFSWAFSSVVSVATPRLAGALRLGDFALLRRLLVRSAVAGLAVTLPLVVAGALAARWLLELVNGSYGRFATTLVLLLLARLVDAATGPLAEALILGDRASWELANQLAGAVVVVVLGFALVGPVGAEGFAWAYAAAFTLQNLLRAAQAHRLLRGSWAVGGATA